MNLHDRTIVDFFWENVDKHSANTLVKYWNGQAWQQKTWSEYGADVEKIAAGLLALGVEKGDAIGIMCNTRVEWGMIDLAILSVGGVTGCIYPTLLGKDASFILDDLKAKIVFVESKTQLAEIFACRDKAPALEHIFLIEGKADGDVHPLEWLIKKGAEGMDLHRRAHKDRISGLRPEEVATVIYTSGTTGKPKGAVHDHRSIVYTAVNNVYPFEPGMTDLSYLPMSHVFERFGGFFGIIYRGDITIAYFRGDMQGLVRDFMEIQPQVNRTAPRLLEKIYAAVKAIVAAKSEAEQNAFQQALELAKQVRVEGELNGKPVSAATRESFEGAMALRPFEKIHQMLGGRMKFFYGGGASIPKEVTEFFFAIGIPVYELYGTSETIGTVTNYPGKTRPGTIGVPFPMVGWTGEPGQTRISADGEIENKGPNVLLQYLNQPRDTAESFTEDGWFKTGDLGTMDKDGFITITGRKKDIIITSGGKNIAPQKIEDLVKESGYFSQVLVYGDNRKYLVALLTVDPGVIPTLALTLGIDTSEMPDEAHLYAGVSENPRTREFVQKVIDGVNSKLFRQEQIVRFLILNRELELEKDEITPTMKLKKKNVILRFKHELDSLYD